METLILIWKCIIVPYWPIFALLIICIILRELIYKFIDNRNEKRAYERQKKAYKDAIKELEKEGN